MLISPGPSLSPQLSFSLSFPKVPPSPELVKRVRDLYHKRLPDVRFLIPVLNGLEKVGKEERDRWSAHFMVNGLELHT